METHRYVRKNLVETNRIDRYDLIVHLSAGIASSQSTEYWTNGTTTLLSVPATVNSFKTSPNFLQPFRRTNFGGSVSAQKNCRMTSSGSSSRSSNAPSNVIRNSLLAGSAAGMASTIACHPFDVIRVNMQSTALATTGSIGVTGTVRNTLQYGGLRALYTGLTLPFAAQAIYKGTVFTVNNLTQQALTEWKTQENYKLGIFSPYEVTLTDRFLCGCMGGAVNGALFVTPVEFVRNQLISQQGSSDGMQGNRWKGPFSVIRRTLQSDGLAGLWRGMTSTILRDSVGCGLFFVAMAYSQEKLSPDQQPSHSVVTTSGAFAGIAFWLWALPIDTMKTWIQNGTAHNLRHALELSQRQGFNKAVPTLCQGWQVAYGRGAPSAAITVTTYSLVHRFLNQ